jgi:hypothetical protein
MSTRERQEARERRHERQCENRELAQADWFVRVVPWVLTAISWGIIAVLALK